MCFANKLRMRKWVELYHKPTMGSNKMRLSYKYTAKISSFLQTIALGNHMLVIITFLLYKMQYW